MASRNQENNTTPSEQENKPMVMESASAYRPDPEHIKRHDAAHKQDMNLAATLQAKWSKVADDQHSSH